MLKTQYSSCLRGNGGMSNLLWGVITINRRSLTSSSSRKLFIVREWFLLPIFYSQHSRSQSPLFSKRKETRSTLNERWERFGLRAGRLFIPLTKNIKQCWCHLNGIIFLEQSIYVQWALSLQSWMPKPILLSAADFEDAFRQLPELLLADSNAHKLRAHHLLNVATSLPDPLDFATAAFTCQEVTCNFSGKGSYLFGWDDIVQHHCHGFGHGYQGQGYALWMFCLPSAEEKYDLLGKGRI